MYIYTIREAISAKNLPRAGLTVFIFEDLNGKIYAYLLDRRIEPRNIHVVEIHRDVDLKLALDKHLLHLQQYGEPPHYVLPAIEWLEKHYPRQ